MRTSTASRGNRNTRIAIAAMEMPRVVENHIPRTPAAMSAAVMLNTNQPSLGLTRSVLRPPATTSTGFTCFAWAMATDTTFSKVLEGVCS